MDIQSCYGLWTYIYMYQVEVVNYTSYLSMPIKERLQNEREKNEDQGAWTDLICCVHRC